MVFKTNYNQRDVIASQEHFTLPSLTVPDDTLSISDIVRNHTRGLPTNARIKEPRFIGDMNMDFANLDHIDKEDMLHAAKSEINAIQTAHQQRIAEKKASRDAKAASDAAAKGGQATTPERNEVKAEK